MLKELGYKYLLIDSEIISQVIEEGFLQEIQTFSKLGRIFILGPNKPKPKIPLNFSFINLSPEIEKSSGDVISKIRESKSSLGLSKVLKLSKNQIKLLIS